MSQNESHDDDLSTAMHNALERMFIEERLSSLSSFSGLSRSGEAPLCEQHQDAVSLTKTNTRIEATRPAQVDMFSALRSFKIDANVKSYRAEIEQMETQYAHKRKRSIALYSFLFLLGLGSVTVGTMSGHQVLGLVLIACSLIQVVRTRRLFRQMKSDQWNLVLHRRSLDRYLLASNSTQRNPSSITPAPATPTIPSLTSTLVLPVQAQELFDEITELLAGLQVSDSLLNENLRLCRQRLTQTVEHFTAMPLRSQGARDRATDELIEQLQMVRVDAFKIVEAIDEFHLSGQRTHGLYLRETIGRSDLDL